MKQAVNLDKDLISQYNTNGPRYTSYPVATQFHDKFRQQDYYQVVANSNEDILPRSLSLYVHIPFCNTVCYYCACNKIITANKARSLPYLEDLFKEIELKGPLFDDDRIVRQLHFGGGTPTFISPESMIELMRVIRENFTLLDDDSGEYSIEIDPREIHPESISLLRNLGFNRMSIGVQDFNPDVQKAINRNQSYEQTLFVLNEARKYGFQSINVDLIYGLPRQTKESFSDTIKKIIEISPDRIAIYNYAHLPHLFKTQKQINENDLPGPDEKLEMLEQSVNLLKEAGYIYIGMDHFAKPDDELAIAQRKGDLYRNFQGYSTNADCDVIGLGVTAISKIGNTYSQNIKLPDDYHSSLTFNKLPILKGIQLSDDDEIRKEVITQLICNFELDYQEIENIFKISFKDYFSNELERLDDLQKDGLLILKNDSIEVLPAGRFLIRNICAVFDAYLDNNQNKTTFSKMI